MQVLFFFTTRNGYLIGHKKGTNTSNIFTIYARIILTLTNNESIKYISLKSWSYVKLFPALCLQCLFLIEECICAYFLPRLF